MKAIERLSVIQQKSQINKNWKHKELFRILRKDDIWIIAYKNIKSNNKNLTSLISNEIFNKINLKILQQLREKVITESYQFKAVNEIQIAKLNCQTESFKLQILNDQIVQEVIRIILEAIYEPDFSKQNFGFCQNLGPHDALEYIESKFHKVDWVIKSDIKITNSSINNKKLCQILKKKIQDVRFINLICKLIKCYSLEQSKYSNLNSNIFQINIVSSILANIYYNEFDQWVQKRLKMIKKSIIIQQNQKQLSEQIIKIREKLKKLNKNSENYEFFFKKWKILKKQKIKNLNKHIQIEYVRYTNDWIIGISGDKFLANQLEVEIIHFLEVRLKQKIHFIKTNITDLRSGKVNFLGYEIYLTRNQNNNSCPQLRFDIPMDSVLKKMEEKGYIKKLIKGHRSISKVNYTTFEDIVILKHFSQVCIRLENYYSGCTNLGKLQYIQYLLYISCAMTLSHRHRSSIKKIFEKHGKTLTVSNGKVKVSFPYRTKWSRMKKKWQNNRKFVDLF